jgi:signal peptidase II
MTWLEPTLAAGAVLVADQLSKALVMARGVAHSTVPGRRFFAIQRVLNRRGVFGSFGGRPGLVGMWAASIAIAALVLHSGVLAPGSHGPAGIGAAVGGATGNLLDQLRRGAVVDFIAIGWWPAFNVADAAIVVGVGLILLSLSPG